jgi:hypothetical protein
MATAIDADDMDIEQWNAMLAYQARAKDAAKI